MTHRTSDAPPTRLLLMPLAALAQVAGSTAAIVTLTERHEAAMRGKMSYLIIGAGGFIGNGRHDVAVPAAQVRDHGGRLEMPGATQDVIRTVPRLDDATDTAVPAATWPSCRMPVSGVGSPSRRRSTTRWPACAAGPTAPCRVDQPQPGSPRASWAASPV